MPSISVVITVYNGERFISEALTSVYNQTRSAHEIIVVNDGSVDNSLGVLERHKDRILLIDQENSGVSAARNAGVLRASGEYVAFLDVDDYWHREKLAVCDDVIASFGRNKIQFLFSDFFREDYFTKVKLPSNTELNPWIFEHLERVPVTHDVFFSSSEDSFDFLMRGYAIYPSTMVVARSRFNSLLWLENFKLSEDFSFSILNSLQGGFTYIDRPLCVVTRHDANASLDQVKMKISDVAVLDWALEQNLFSLKKKQAIKASLGHRLAALGWQFRSRNRKEALRYYLRAIRYRESRYSATKGIIRTLLPM